jgi:hypothetical protein
MIQFKRLKSGDILITFKKINWRNIRFRFIQAFFGGKFYYVKDKKYRDVLNQTTKDMKNGSIMCGDFAHRIINSGIDIDSNCRIKYFK